MSGGISRGQGANGLKPISIGDPDKVTSWPPAWEKKAVTVTDRRGLEDPQKELGPPKEPPVAQVDQETQAAIRRSKFLHEHMSAENMLGLPPRLEAQRLKWGIPDEAFASRALFDRVHVWPLELHDNAETYGGTSIVKPNSTRMRDLQQGYRGILISAGLKAMDELMSNGVELGDVVHTIKNVPHAHECLPFEKWGFYFLVMRTGDLNADETLELRVRSGETRLEDVGGDDRYCHQIAGIKKVSAFISEHEW